MVVCAHTRTHGHTALHKHQKRSGNSMPLTLPDERFYFEPSNTMAHPSLGVSLECHLSGWRLSSLARRHPVSHDANSFLPLFPKKLLFATLQPPGLVCCAQTHTLIILYRGCFFSVFFSPKGVTWSGVEMYTPNLLRLTPIILVMLRASFQEGSAHRVVLM